MQEDMNRAFGAMTTAKNVLTLGCTLIWLIYAYLGCPGKNE
jgi:hypothetical protein